MKNRLLLNRFEAAFDALYLLAVLVMGCVLIVSAQTGAAALFGVTALVLGAGDAFHLVPRMASSMSQSPERFKAALGRGKLVTSITMTVFYVLLWHIGLLYVSPQPAFWNWTIAVYALAAVRVVLCLLPQNRWEDGDAPMIWSALRNAPFMLLGVLVALLFFLHRAQGFAPMWIAILLSFAFYIPVALGAQKYPFLGMLMLPKTLAYVWMIAMAFYAAPAL